MEEKGSRGVEVGDHILRKTNVGGSVELWEGYRWNHKKILLFNKVLSSPKFNKNFAEMPQFQRQLDYT